MAALLLGLQAAEVPAADTDDVSAKAAPVIIYKPPVRGAPKTRVGAGSRGSGDAAVLQVLAPDHTGLTTVGQPTLYWYASTPGLAHFEVALIDAESIDPLLEVEAEDGMMAGIHHLNLEDYGLSLQPGTPYQWSVALVADADNRSSDLVASGLIERIEPDEELANRISNSSGVDLVNVYASAGIWYDALHELSTLITESPDDAALIALRDNLLEQVDLQAVTGH
ncbi:MAG: DUF928 domain-containing protein [Gammaproteobacteria bacterium]